jgi:hypothetical protein
MLRVTRSYFLKSWMIQITMLDHRQPTTTPQQKVLVFGSMENAVSPAATSVSGRRSPPLEGRDDHQHLPPTHLNNRLGT